MEAATVTKKEGIRFCFAESERRSWKETKFFITIGKWGWPRVTRGREGGENGNAYRIIRTISSAAPAF